MESGIYDFVHERTRKFKEGKAGGIIDTLLDLGYANEDILSTLQKKLGIDRDQAEGYLKRFYEGTL